MAQDFHGPGNDAMIDISELSLSELDELGATAVSEALRDVLGREEQDITATFGSQI